MAVVVQRLAPAEVAGVLFTANPRTAARDEMLIEAAWGLGETVVSGSVQPDVVVVDRETGREKSYAVAEKAVWIEPGSGQLREVDAERRRARCLSERNVRDLWDLGRRVAEHFGSEQDIEWAICDGRPVLLQSRAITTLAGADAYRECLEATRQWLRRRKAAGGGDWVRHNIAETLPHPTPLSWSVVRQFMLGSGGFGELNRIIGFEPSEQVCREGFLELIAGRVYLDVQRAPEMYFAKFPFQYDTDLLRCRPDAAQQPPTIPGGSLRTQLDTAKRLGEIEKKVSAMAVDCDRRLREQLVPEFTAWVAEEKQRDLAALSVDEWLDLWQQRCRRVLDEFGPQSLLPSMIAAMGIERLEAFLKEHFWDRSPENLLNLLAIGDNPDRTVVANDALRAVGMGEASLDEWLAAHGHRGPEEFDLAALRWREQPGEARKMAAMLANGESPLAIHENRIAEAEQRAASLRARLSARYRREFDERLSLVRRYLPWREDGKAALMLGYELLREMALDAARRLEIGDDVFLLSFDELSQALTTGEVPKEIIEQRRRQRAAERRLSLPLFIGEAEIDDLGQPPKTTTGRSLTAVPISTGSATGPVQIVHAPREAGDLPKGYVLVCPSTDPSWTPLFVDAAALVLECGGMLSHGAVVAREMGIPAVVLPDATRLLQSGETIAVDGQHGVVLRQGAGESIDEAAVDPADVRIAPEKIPPVRGPGERRAAVLRSASFVFWGVYLAAVFLLPQPWFYDPSMKLLDAALWPLVPALGMPGTVAAMAVGLALATMIGQRLLTDNRRLLAAKQRSNLLRRKAAGLPVGSPRRAALSRAAAGVQPRLLGAAFVPLAVLLGPMVMSFVWLPERVDPASWNPPPGAVAFVTAEVDGEYTGEVRLKTAEDTDLKLDPQTRAVRSMPPIRRVLTALLARWQQPAEAADEKAPAAEVVESLAEYLDESIPRRRLSWTIRTPDAPAGHPIALTAGDAEPAETALVVGNRFPPPAKEDLDDGRGPVQVAYGPKDSPVRRATVTYQFPRTQGDRVFLAPLADVSIPAIVERGWDRWDAGWLLTYIAVYLVVLLPVRWLLRIP